MSKKWKESEFDCDDCGSICKVLTSAKEEGYFYDGDDVECTECGYKGSVHFVEDCEGDEVAIVIFNDED